VILTHPLQMQQLMAMVAMNANGERSNVMAKDRAISAVPKNLSAPIVLVLLVAMSKTGNDYFPFVPQDCS
jgi:hypothetical protein